MKGTTTQLDVTIGLDLGDKWSQAVVLDAAGEVVEERRVATTKVGLARIIEQYAGCLVVMEVGTHSPWVSRLFKDCGFRVITANPRQVRLISESQRKTDRFDAQMLSRLGRLDPSLLSPVHHRDEEAQKHRALLQARDGLVRCRTMLINQTRGLAKSLGVRLPSCSADVFDRRAREAVGDDLFPGLATLLSTIGQHTADIHDLDEEVEQLSRQRYPEVAGLQQVPGVGPITSLSFVLTVEDPERFATSRTVGAYLGLCPRLHSSGDQQPQLRISKCGDPLLRQYLVQASHYILGPFGPDCDLRRFGLRICERGGKNARKRAVVAVARKLAVLLHHLWFTGEVYEPLINADRAARRAA
jgi:transposase